jgi:hypothetical protein
LSTCSEGSGRFTQPAPQTPDGINLSRHMESQFIIHFCALPLCTLYVGPLYFEAFGAPVATNCLAPEGCGNFLPTIGSLLQSRRSPPETFLALRTCLPIPPNALTPITAPIPYLINDEYPTIPPSPYPSLHKDKTHRIMFSAQIPPLAGRVTDPHSLLPGNEHPNLRQAKSLVVRSGVHGGVQRRQFSGKLGWLRLFHPGSRIATTAIYDWATNQGSDGSTKGFTNDVKGPIRERASRRDRWKQARRSLPGSA